MQDRILKNMSGELEIFVYKKGKLIQYDRGPNTVTVWAKHATMHLLSGEMFGSWDVAPSNNIWCQRLFDSDSSYAHKITGSPALIPGEGSNADGTLMSGQQYFSSNTDPDFALDKRWSQSTINAATADGDRTDTDTDMKLPFFPTKILFGTGFEFSSWSEIATSYPDYATVYTSEGWDSSTFNGPYGAYQTLQNDRNIYSNSYTSPTLNKRRSMNDIYAGALTTPTILDTDFAIPGAIKNGVYQLGDPDSKTGAAGQSIPPSYTMPADNQRWWPSTDPDSGLFKTEWIGGNEFLKKAWQGVGDPCFLYSRRESRFFQNGSEVLLSNDSYLENKITVTTVMPEQTGVNAGIFYPYNGYVLKVAGLYCDARCILGNSVPTGGPGDEDPAENDDYLKMKHGMIMAKRYIAPINKSHDVSITCRWTLYL
jgi:hypothetical protein